MIELRFARVEFTADGAISHFPDGSCWGAHPHDAPHYHALAHRLGYEGDILRYCREHELAHHLVAENFNRPSAVLSLLAKGLTPPRMSAASEEALAMCLQRYVRTNEHPFVDQVHWEALRERMRKHLAEA